MKSKQEWVVSIGGSDGSSLLQHDAYDGSRPPVHSICFSADGSTLLVTSGIRINVYDTRTGELINYLQGHTGPVYCLAASKDGKRYASGGGDKLVIIWTSEFEGVLKYHHNDPIQALAYNPATAALASCTATDFGVWSPEQKKVTKHQVSSKILSAAWTNDGQYLALGHFNGHISIRSQAKPEVEKVQIIRPGPVWTLAWNPDKELHYDVLAVGDWSGRLSFYYLSGKQIGRDKVLGYDPTCISWYPKGKLFAIGGSNRELTLYTKDGVKLQAIDTKDDWVWSTAVRTKSPNYIACGTNKGILSLHTNAFSVVHGLYQDQYAYRENMTDVIVQNLVTEKKTKIQCRDYVKKIAIFKDRLAIQMGQKIVIYALAFDESGVLQYREMTKIEDKLDCNLLVVTSNNLILCQEKRLQLYSFQGIKEREWVLESMIKYIKVVGGPPSREGLLVGLKSGLIVQIFVDNPFPISLIRQPNAVRCLDISADRQKLAVVDDRAECVVYEIASGKMLFKEPNANSVAWNSENDDMLAFSGNGVLSIKAGNFETDHQKMKGFVVGFKGSKIFCLHVYAMLTIDVPQGPSLRRYLEKKDYSRAYQIATLGVTQDDWRELALATLEALEFDIARKAFIRLRDIRYIELLALLEKEKRKMGSDPKELLGDIYAYQGRFTKAVDTYKSAGKIMKAIEMYLDLRMWNEARKLAEESKVMDVSDLLRLQAEMLEKSKDLVGASDLYITSGNVLKGLQLKASAEDYDGMIRVVRDHLNKMDVQALTLCADTFTKIKKTDYAIETLNKLGDAEKLIDLYIIREEWEQARALIESHPMLASKFWLPYAHHLAMTDRWQDALRAFVRAGHPELALKVLNSLTRNSVMENRFSDAGYYFWTLAKENLRIAASQDEVSLHLVDQFHDLQRKAQLYYAYNFIHKFTKDPFTSLGTEPLFNISRYLYNEIQSTRPTTETPLGISLLNIMYCLSKQGDALECYKLTRHLYDRMKNFVIPVAWQDRVDLSAIAVRSKPVSDKDDILPMCPRCKSGANSLLSGDIGANCVACGHPFTFSFYSFDTLPLVEFTIEPDLSLEEAIKLLKMDPPIRNPKSGGKGGDKWKENKTENVQTMSFNDDDDDDDEHDEHDDDGTVMGGEGENDPFHRLLTPYEDEGASGGPVVVNRAYLRAMSPTSVYIQDFGTVIAHTLREDEESEDDLLGVGVSPLPISAKASESEPSATPKAGSVEAVVASTKKKDRLEKQITKMASRIRKLVPVRFWKNILPSTPVFLCEDCQQFFHEEDFELTLLQSQSCCSFCRTSKNLATTQQSSLS